MSGNFWTTSNKYFFELVASHFSILYKMVRSFKISIKVINEGLLHVKSIYLWCRLVRSTSVIFPVTKALLRSMILFVVALFLRQFWPVQDFLTGLWFCNLSGLFSRNVKIRSSRPEVFLRKGVLRYAANLQENAHAEVRFR